MKISRAFLTALALLLPLAASAAAESRTVFVNPAAGKVYHKARECEAVPRVYWAAMTEMTAGGLYASEYGSYRKCGVCFGEVESATAPMAVGQIGEQGLYYPMWQPDGLEQPWQERVVSSTDADLNHDGLPDRVDICVFPDEAGRGAAELVDGPSLGFVKVYLGCEGGGWAEEARFVSRGVNGAHVANGTIALVRRDGEDYLLDADFYAAMGTADYSYTVYSLRDGMGISVLQTRSTAFSTDGSAPVLPDAGEALPAFRAALEAWLPQSRVLLSAHADLPALVAEGEGRHPLEEVTGPVWRLFEGEQ